MKWKIVTLLASTSLLEKDKNYLYIVREESQSHHRLELHQTERYKEFKILVLDDDDDHFALKLTEPR